MRLLITGATGFIGRNLVRQALAAGHQVTALVRRLDPDLPCETLQCDLLENVPRLPAHGFDAAIHLAAALSGSPDYQRRLTVDGTRNLLAALTTAGVWRLVGISSLAVIDFPRLAAGAVVDERAPRLRAAPGIAPYALTKAAQEDLFCEFGAQPGQCATVLRPGLVYDARVLSDAYSGFRFGPLHVRARHDGQIPVTQCDALVRCMLSAADISTAGCRVYHILDEPLPDLIAYVQELRRRGNTTGNFALNWRWFRAAAVIGQLAARALPVPEVFTAQGFATRLKPLRYSTELARRELHWAPAAFDTQRQGHVA
ncbi:MAG: NAD-dependent epimerase/dehydratase family protein [Steroidobacteraceae bacterium]